MSAEGAAEVGTVEGVGVDSIAFAFAKRKASLQSKPKHSVLLFESPEDSNLLLLLLRGGERRGLRATDGRSVRPQFFFSLAPLLVQQQQEPGGGGRRRTDSNLLLLLLRGGERRGLRATDGPSVRPPSSPTAAAGELVRPQYSTTVGRRGEERVARRQRLVQSGERRVAAALFFLERGPSSRNRRQRRSNSLECSNPILSTMSHTCI